MRVLVVHRHTSVTRQIKEYLPQCIVSCTECGWTGLTKVRSRVFDLIISGYDLPVITGFEMVRSLRMFSQNPNIPVIMLEDGNESLAYKILASQLQVSLMKLNDVQSMRHTELWLN